jgi:hypothetical protein
MSTVNNSRCMTFGKIIDIYFEDNLKLIKGCVGKKISVFKCYII